MKSSFALFEKRLLRDAQFNKKGDVFLGDGTKVQGSIIKLNVLAFGKANDRFGALLPLEKEIFSSQTSALKQRKIYLKETNRSLVAYILLKGFREKQRFKKKTALEVLEAGGFVAWIIVFLGGFGALIGLIRAVLLLLSRLARSTKKRLSNLQEGKGSSMAFFPSCGVSKTISRSTFGGCGSGFTLN